MSSADFFQNSLFSKYSFRSAIRVSNSLDPDKDLHSDRAFTILKSIDVYGPDKN